MPKHTYALCGTAMVGAQILTRGEGKGARAHGVTWLSVVASESMGKTGARRGPKVPGIGVPRAQRMVRLPPSPLAPAQHQPSAEAETVCRGRTTSGDTQVAPMPGSWTPRNAESRNSRTTSGTEPSQKAGFGSERASTETRAATPAEPRASSGFENRRRDAPVVKQYKRGSLELALTLASDPALRAECVNSFNDLKFAATSKRPRSAKLGVWRSLSTAAGFDPESLTPKHMNEVAAVMQAAHYRSVQDYVTLAKMDFLRNGGQWTDTLRVTHHDLQRAATRGLGPPARAAPFPLHLASQLPDGPEPLVEGGPLWPKRFIIAGCWWLSREVEIGNARRCDIRLAGPEAAWELPASKTNPAALGVVRTLLCTCTGQQSDPICPSCTLKTQKQVVEARFPNLPHAPLFPTSEGEHVTKKAAVDTICEAADKLGLDMATSSGALKFGGHSLRRGGAHFLAEAGVEVSRIQLHARHSSFAILHT